MLYVSFVLKRMSIFSRLEKSINSYKEEYAQLISQAEAIKTDLKHVQVQTILSSLSSFVFCLPCS
jgi:hypothetical protein